MSRITSGVGLVTGFDIEKTVTQLLSISARPKNLLTDRTKGVQSERLAVEKLASQVLSLKFSSNALTSDATFNARTATTSDEKALAVTIPKGSTPAPGSFRVVPARTASALQVVSNRFDGAEVQFESGSLTISSGGGLVDRGVALAELNHGAGVTRGAIKITDRSGNSAVIDLSLAVTVDDVLEAINSSADVSVVAATEGDRFTLTDASGGDGRLLVQEVGRGKTASDLGLGGISVEEAKATGGDVFALHAGTRLSTLHGGRGVYFSRSGVNDISIKLGDGAEAGIDLTGSETIGDVLDAINKKPALLGKIEARIAADGTRLELVDLSSGSGTLKVEAGPAGSAAADLGLVGEGAGGTLAGQRLSAGLRDTLLSQLNGGKGLGPLGTIKIIDRTGAESLINLASAITLSDVVARINEDAVGITASVNSVRNGIVITDTTEGTGALVIESADAAESAEALGIAVNGQQASVNSGSLKRQTLGLATRLDSLKGGLGVKLGDLRLTDANGDTGVADLNGFKNEAETLGDVIGAINALDLALEARLNDSGDGILIVSTAEAGADGTLTVKDTNGDVAAALHLTRKAKTIEIDDTPTLVIDGSSTYAIDLSEVSTASSAEDVLLSTLNDGLGIDASDIRITDSRGISVSLDLNGGDANIATVGQLIDAINERASASGAGIKASVNSSKSGILLEDTAGGSGKITVRDVNGSAAADLNLARPATTTGGKQTIDGAGLFTVNSAARGLDAIAARINELGADVTASTIFDGVGYRLSISGDRTGAVNQLLIDGEAAGLEFTETSRAQDALLAYGGASAADGVLVSSPTNDFKQVLGGVDVTVLEARPTSVAVNVASDDSALIDKVQDLIDAYNAIRENLAEQTSFDAEELTTGILFGTNVALQVDTRLAGVFSGRFSGAGRLRSLEQVGISVNADGTLALDAETLSNAFAADPDAVRDLFGNKDRGLVARLNAQVDSLAADENSLLIARSSALQSTIDANNERLDAFTQQLDRERERLTAQFTQLELIIARLRDSQSALNNLSPIPPLGR